MKRSLVLGLAMVLALGLGCATKKVKKEQQGLVEQSSEAIRFAGYKYAGLWRGSPSEVDRYLRTPGYWELKSGMYKFKPVVGGELQKLGESFKGRFEIGTISLNAKFVLINYKPGQEIWYLVNLENRIYLVLRFSLKESAKGAKVTVTGNGDTGGALGELLDLVNLPEMLAKLVDTEAAKGQAHFDSSADTAELLGHGNLGNFFDSFLQQYQAGILINASLRKVNDYLITPECWELFRTKYGIEMSECFIKGQAGPCPIKVNLLGSEFSFNAFTVDYKFTDHSTSYGVLGNLICRFIISTRPEAGGTRLTFTVATELPAAVSQEAGDTLMGVMQLPKFMEQILVNAKNAVEGSS
jgi:hypothetical protein